MSFFISFLLLFCSQNSSATSLSSETSAGSTSAVEALTIDGDLATPKKSAKQTTEREEKFPWSAGYTYSTLQTNDVSGGAVTNKTSAVNASLGYESPSRFEVGGGYAFSSTPDENLVTLGPNLYLGYTFQKANEKAKPVAHIDSNSNEEEASVFAPSLGLKMTGGTNRFVQTFTPNPSRFSKAKRPTTGINEITQTSLQLESSIKPAEWIRIKPSYTIFKYNRNVADFNNTLSSPRIAISRAAFTNTVSGLAEFDASLGITFYFLDSWELAMNGDYSVMAADQSSTWIEKLEVSDNIGDWKIGVGANAQTSASVTDTTALLDISYDF